MKVMVRHVVEVWPRHDLKKTSIYGRWNAVCWGGSRRTCRAGRMDVVHVDAGSHDLFELFERVSPFRQPRFVRRQVAGDNVGAEITSITRRIEAWRESWTEVCASSQVGGWVDFLRLAKVRVPTRSVIEVGRAARGVTRVAIGDGVHPVAAQSNQVDVFSLQIQRDGRYFQAPYDARQVSVSMVVAAIVLRVHTWWNTQPTRQSNSTQREG